MNALTSAIQFITILPVGGFEKFDARASVPFFPIVGIILGAMLSAVDYGALHFWSPGVAAVIDIVFLAAVTGAFHLDGLGDSADGLFSHRGRERALEIMKDSRVGVMGLVAIVCGLAVKWGGIASLSSHRVLLLILIPAYARGSMLFGMRFLSYGREGGTGRAFFDDPLKISAFWGLLVPAGLSLFLGWQALWLNFWFVVLTAGICRYYQKQMGCVTGDMLGAMSEVIESVLFLIASMEVLG